MLVLGRAGGAGGGSEAGGDDGGVDQGDDDDDGAAGGDGGNYDGWTDKDEISDVKSEDDDCRIGQGDIQNLNLKIIFPPGCPTASLCPLLSLQGRRLPWEGVLMLFLRYLNNNKINNYLGKVR